MMRGPERTVPDERPDHRPADEEAPPVLGSWKRLYAAVVLNALLVMVLVFVFSRWRY
jgi:hypothetical protein